MPEEVEGSISTTLPRKFPTAWSDSWNQARRGSPLTLTQTVLKLRPGVTKIWVWRKELASITVTWKLSSTSKDKKALNESIWLIELFFHGSLLLVYSFLKIVQFLSVQILIYT